MLTLLFLSFIINCEYFSVDDCAALTGREKRRQIMNKTLRNSLALLLCVVLVLGALPFVSAANDGTPEFGTIAGNVAYVDKEVDDTVGNYGAIFVGGNNLLEIHGGTIQDNESKGGTSVRVNGKTVGSKNVIDEAEGPTIIKDKISVNSGTDLTITGGTFTTNPTTWVPSTGYTVTQNADSTYTVTKNP